MALLIVAGVVPTVGQAQDVYEKREIYQQQVASLAKRTVGELQDRFNAGGVAQEYYERGVDWISNEGPALAQNVGQKLWTYLRGAFGFFGYILGLFLVPIYLFYFLKEGHHIRDRWSDYLPIKASRFKDEVVGTLTEINRYLIAFFRGQMVVSLIDGALVAVALWAIGVPYALLIGVFLALLGLIPFIGSLIVMIPAILIAFAHFGISEWGTVMPDEVAQVGEVVQVKLESSGKIVEKVATEVAADGARAEVLVNAWNWLPVTWAYPLIVLGIFVVLQQVNGLVTAPKIVGDSVGLHPLTVIFSVLFWSLLLGGLLGALLAVPLTAAIKVLFKRYIWEKRIEPAVGKRLQNQEAGV